MGRTLALWGLVADMALCGIAWGGDAPKPSGQGAATDAQRPAKGDDQPAAPPPGSAGELPAPPPPATAPVQTSPATEALRRELDNLKEEVATQKALLDAGLGGQEDTGKDAALRIYGWTDMGLNKTWMKKENVLNAVLPTTANTFVVGNINLYFDFQPFEKWSTLFEVRLTNLPDGAHGVSNNMLQPTTSTMYNDYGSALPWSFTKLGGLILERAYIQYRHNDLLQIRIGQFLTPFGIWNVDHGTPTLIALALPVFLVQNLFPRAQIGIEALGSGQVADWRLGYSAYVSNGRTPYQVDPTDDKMLGGRFYARTSRPWRLQLGLSGLTGRFSEKRTTVTSFVPLAFTETEVTAYREVDLGADLSLDVGSLRIRTELSRGQYNYEEGKRAPSVFNIPGAKTADNVMLDWYLLTAYRLPWLNLEPYLYYEYFQWRSGLAAGYMGASGGLNIYFAPAAQLRLQYIHDFVFDSFSPWQRLPSQDFDLFIARVVLGF